MSQIYITGDTHGDIDFGKLSTAKWKKGSRLTKGDYLIILGDAGIIWYGGRKDNYLKKWYEDKPWTTLFIDGNHENHHSLAAYPVEEWNGGKVHRISDSVLHLMRGEYYNIDGTTLWVMGGAESIDRIYRTEGISWWPEEMPSYEEMEHGVETLRSHGMSVDYIITHDCARSLVQYIYGYPSGDGNQLQNYFDNIEFQFDVKFKHWYFGHHHRDKKLGSKHTCVYNDIIQIK